MNGASQGTMNNERDDDKIKKIVEIASALPRRMIVVLKLVTQIKKPLTVNSILFFLPSQHHDGKNIDP
jgi:hypothetical protein